MQCPKCNETTTVKDSRNKIRGRYRRHWCGECGYRFNTMEMVTGKNNSFNTPILQAEFDKGFSVGFKEALAVMQDFAILELRYLKDKNR